jgi:hypothetical protein
MWLIHLTINEYVKKTEELRKNLKKRGVLPSVDKILMQAGIDNMVDELKNIIYTPLKKGN